MAIFRRTSTTRAGRSAITACQRAREQMAEILAHIERELQLPVGASTCIATRASGAPAWSPGCLLIERGARRWRAGANSTGSGRTCDRSRTWPYVPETDAQSAFVRDWKTPRPSPWQRTRRASRSGAPREGRSPMPSQHRRDCEDRFRGALLGLAVGDALACHPRLKPGSFAPVAGFVGRRGARPAAGRLERRHCDRAVRRRGPDRMWTDSSRATRWSAAHWQQNGHLTATGQCVGITDNTAQALAAARWRRQVFSGLARSEAPGSRGPTRVAPTVIFSFRLARGSDTPRLRGLAHHLPGPGRAGCLPAVRSARCTPPWRRSPRSAFSIRRSSFGYHGRAAQGGGAPAQGAARSRRVPARRSPRHLAAALWAFETTSTFHEGALRAANLGGRSDAVAAAYGQLAGAALRGRGHPGRVARRAAQPGLDRSLRRRASGPFATSRRPPDRVSFGQIL